MAQLPSWASKPCMLGIDEAGRGPVLGPMVYACAYCPSSYQKTLATLEYADSKTLKESKREELFEAMKADESMGWAVDVIDPRILSSLMLAKVKTNLNLISHNSAMGLISRVLNSGIFVTEVFVDTVGDAEKYEAELSKRFPGITFKVAKKADSLFPIVSAASIAAKVTRDKALKEWIIEETGQEITREFGSGYPGDPVTKEWLQKHLHNVFGFPTLVRFSWETCKSIITKNGVEVHWEAEHEMDEGKVRYGKTVLMESNAIGRHDFFVKRKLQQIVTRF
ncbi:hypothetical protein KP509_20G086300 [Ceratopteris richardii]|uniref:Ribonuclease n=2 Tax=Ceratopteris richardii TaxID=49495 RepID=A0A8T2SH32_CERRI|nr:hypothetical protein KP509_20G086300 [Ceratopteris richardii]